MPMPGIQDIRRPLLEALKGEAPHNFATGEMLELVAEYFSINLNDLSSGDKNVLKSHINEAKASLKKNKLIYNPSGNTYMITNDGNEVLEAGPEVITDEYLRERRKKPFSMVEAFGLDDLPNTRTETIPDDIVIDEPDIFTDDTPEPEMLTDDSQDITLGDEPDTVPEITNDILEPETFPEDIVLDDVEPDTLTDDSHDISLDDKTDTFPETTHDTLEPDTLPDDSQDIALDDEPDTFQETQNDTLELETLTDDSQNIALNEPDTLPEIANDTLDTETLTDNSQDISLDDEPDTFPETTNDTLETDTIPDDSQDITLDEPDTLPEATHDTLETETLPEDSQDIMLDEAETLPDDSQDITLGDEPDTLPEAAHDTLEPDILPEDSHDITLDDPELPDDSKPETLPNDSQDITPDTQEILHTEEVHNDTMPDDTYSPEETLDEQSYDPSLVAEAMSSDNIDDAVARHNSELADELLMKAASLPSDRFEMLVIDLLSKMGYFAFQTARYTTESSGSDLIHGVILDNKTGANIYIQARKLSPGRTVGKADIQDFVDELSDKGGKGIFATTANFSENATALAADERIMLIDGEKLANLMIANNFCVNVEKVYEVKAIDNDSFSEYEG